MKKFFVLAVFVFIIVFGSPATAAESMKFWSYDMLTIQTPSDWTAVKEKTSISFFNADRSAGIEVVMVEPYTGLTSRQFAEKLRAEMNGTKITDNGDGLFTFTNVKDGNVWRNSVGIIETSMVAVSVTGKDPNLEAVMKSLRLKLTFTPNIKSLF